MEVEYSIRVKREIDDDDDAIEAYRRTLAEVMDANIKVGTYEVEALAREDQSRVPVVDEGKFKSIKELNQEVRNLARRTVAALSALGLGQRGTLVDSWRALTEEGALSERLDASLKAKIELLDRLEGLVDKALGAIDAFEGAKRELDQTCDEIARNRRHR